MVYVSYYNYTLILLSTTFRCTTVINNKTDLPIVGACIKLKEKNEVTSEKSCSSYSDDKGKFIIENLELGEMQLILEKENYHTQYQDIKINKEGTVLNTIFMLPLNELKSIPITGGFLISKNKVEEEIKVEIPNNTFNQITSMSLTSMEGVEIPSELPKTDDNKSFFPFSTINIYTPTKTIFNNEVKIIVPLPFHITEGVSLFKLNEESGVWENIESSISFENNNSVFYITEIGTYSMMIEGEDKEELIEEIELSDEPAQKGEIIRKTVFNELEFPSDLSLSEENFLRSIAEKQYKTSFNKPIEITVMIPSELSDTQTTIISKTELPEIALLDTCFKCGITWKKKIITDTITIGRPPLTWGISFTKTISIPIPYCHIIPCPTGGEGGN